MISSLIIVDKVVFVRIAPMNEFHPSATGNECRSARSSGKRSPGARLALTRARISASSGVLVGGGVRDVWKTHGEIVEVNNVARLQ